MMVKNEIWDEYADKIIDGRQTAGTFMVRCAQRFKALRSDSGTEFRAANVRKVIAFFKILRHFAGKHAGKPFTLEPWQQFIVAYIFGFYRDGHRLVRHVYIEMARKNGKTALAAGLCLYALTMDGEMSAEVDLAANSKEQAKIAFEFASNFAKGIDPSNKILKAFRDKIFYQRALSKMQVFAADDSKLDGFNASTYLLDEYHAAKNSRLRDVLESSQGMRENPLAIVITTAGFDKLSPCYQYRTMCAEVVSGVREDDTTAAFIYSLDAGDKWDDANTWIKSNPNLGVTVQKEYIEEQVRSAHNLPSAEVGVRTKTINEWCDAASVWIPDHYILEATRAINMDDYKDMDCYCGVDLSATTDLTALSLCIPTDSGEYVFGTRYYLPEQSLKENRFKIEYGEWHRRGWLTLTPGNVTDYDYILNDLDVIYNNYRLISVAYDQWNATQFVNSCVEHGLPMKPFSQALGNFNRPTKEMERLMLSGRIIIDNNEITRHCFRNVAMARDRNGNIKPSKEHVEKKIDGVIAMIEALGACIDEIHYDNTI
jgi:phage terminase large subunit-like protein